ncbi:hypothetical protein [Mesorhizobium sp. CN2-181]|uniref:hypothetical protein n=1 Tax=Mesorhizobium yinganensis TaxID=3157707 RepID=UPI0032B74BE7
MNRRKLLAGGAAALPLAVAGVSTVEAAPVAEYPIETMTRLAKPFVKALQDWHADLGTSDTWLAEIHPRGSFGLVSIEALSRYRRPSPIAELFQQWQEARDTDVSGMTEAEAEVILATYQRLQQAIIDAEPSTPSDVAMQFVADSDCCDSANSQQFVGRLCRLAGVSEPQ